MKSKRKTLAEAMSLVKDGDQIITGGWTVVRKPMAAVYEIIRQGKKGLHLVTGTPGTDADLLIGAGCVAISEQCYIGHELFGHPYNFRRAVEGGTERSGLLHDDSSLLVGWLRILAAAMGIPFIPTRSAKGSDMLNPEYDRLQELRGKNPKIPNQKFTFMQDPFWEGEEVMLVPAVRPDVAIIHAQEAAEDGTVRINNCPFGDRITAMAAKTTIVTAERIVPADRLRNIPELNTIPGIYVDAVVEVPYGAHPTLVANFYDNDPWWYKEYIDASKDEVKFKLWLNEWVYGVKNHEGYLRKLGQDRLKSIQADANYGYNPNLRRRLDLI
ncbi:hypothetical protein SY88_20635 [Clostridiales bacterium PH28_bin88]|nr:hypothetical protein SY88_20635 [Clostridiales bacterium PH28_bin88]